MCGILGLLGPDSEKIVLEALIGLEHRGQDSAGLYDGKKIIKLQGCVSDTFKDIEIEKSNIYIGHTRYSTIPNKKVLIENIQPMYSEKHDFVFCHNGHVENINFSLRKFGLETNEFSDSYSLMLILEKLKSQNKTWNKTLIKFLDEIDGSFSIIIYTGKELIAMKDNRGTRPLCYGIKDDNIIVSSESTIFKDYTYVREIKNGEIIIFRDSKNIEYINYLNIEAEKKCPFEYIYFSRHDSNITSDFDINDFRRKCGQIMAEKEKEILTENVVYIPSTSIPSAEGFSSTLGLKCRNWISKVYNTKRTFILSSDDERILALKRKFSFSEELKGKSIYLIDDSIVRGNTMYLIIKLLREYGVSQIHLRIMSPKIVDKCYYGIDMGEKLIAKNKNNEEISQTLNSDSLKYLEIADLNFILGKNICTSCFTGNYDW